MPRKKRQFPEEGFQMAPMIDMVFLLLVFFMCVSSMADADKAVPLELPVSDQSKVPDEMADRGTISIDANGAVYLGEQVVNAEAMKQAIKTLMQRQPDSRIVLRADSQTEYRYIRRVLQDCAEAGAYEIIYATYEGG